MFDINVASLRSKSTAAVLLSEMGVVSSNYINKKQTKKPNVIQPCTVVLQQRKGKHFYGQFNPGENFLSAGVRGARWKE